MSLPATRQAVAGARRRWRPPCRTAGPADEREGAELTIENAVIRSPRIGSCRATARVKCAGVVIVERGSRRLDLHSEIDLRSGVPIGPSRTK